MDSSFLKKQSISCISLCPFHEKGIFYCKKSVISRNQGAFARKKVVNKAR
ncbi:hypothetical protein C2W64_02097 [Brevibacillus laterosporus]|nr:hypothetical protein C2W64_02097 [Brevibacillus laterosporus]